MSRVDELLGLTIPRDNAGITTWPQQELSRVDEISGISKQHRLAGDTNQRAANINDYTHNDAKC